MPVTDQHPDYQEHITKWKRCRDAAAGEDAIKKAGRTYLPQLDKQTEPQYQAYLSRAMFYGAVKRTVKGMAGFIRRKEPKIELPKSKEDLLQTIGSCGESFNQITRTVLEDQLKVGRIGLLVDADPDQPEYPSISIYTAENIELWREAFVGGRRIPVMVKLREDIELPGKDEFGCERETQYRVLKLKLDDTEATTEPTISDQPKAEYTATAEDLENSYYYVELWRKKKDTTKGQAVDEWYIHDTITPHRKGGKTFQEIPFTIINASSTDTEVEESPIIDLVNVNLSHYRNSADLEHGRHYTALPTPWVAGFDPKQELTIGSSQAWIAANENAKAGYLEFTGQGLGHIAEGMKDKQQLMAVLGARLLEENKAAAEAAETLTIRQAGEQSVLANIADAASEGLTRVLRHVWQWTGEVETDDYTVTLNKDFTVAGIDSALLNGLMMAAQSGMISWSTFFWNVKRGELIPDNVKEEDEAAKIAIGPPGGLPGGSVSPPGAISEEEDTEEEPEDEEDEEEKETVPPKGRKRKGRAA